MKKPEIARTLARRAGVSEGEAADRLDHAVHEILSRLRKGQKADLPGLGRFSRLPGGGLRFDRAMED